MKFSKELMMTLSVMCMFSGAAMAGESVQAYAHPTLFGTQTHTAVTADSDVIVGGKIFTPKSAKTIAQKENVIVGRCARHMLHNMKSQMDAKRGELFNPAMPVLRSELAYLIAEGLDLSKSNPSEYSDLENSYWAKEQIEQVLAADVMIGYPDSTFKPDRAITKAEVLCTFAKLMNIEADATKVPTFNGQPLKYVPTWAYGAANEVIASGVLNALPETDKLVNDEYLSKKQVAYFVAAMKNSFKIDMSNGAIGCATKCEPVAVKIKLSERLSARVSNVGDTFTAKTTEEVKIGDLCFPVGSTVTGKVVSVSRPGVKNPGFLEVQFESIKNGEDCANFPKKLCNAEVNVMKDPNLLARFIGAPFSAVGRVAGVAGRTISEGAEVVANGVEEYAGNWSDAFVDTLSLHPLKGLKSVGSSFITVGKGVFNLSKLVVSGTFGVLYEFYDECKYLIVPKTTNDSCLNADEELTILY